MTEARAPAAHPEPGFFFYAADVSFSEKTTKIVVSDSPRSRRSPRPLTSTCTERCVSNENAR